MQALKTQQDATAHKDPVERPHDTDESLFMSPAMAAAAGELIQQFMKNPTVPISAQDFLLI